MSVDPTACATPGGLDGYGMTVDLLDEHFPKTPIVVGHLQGARPGPTIVLNGISTPPRSRASRRGVGGETRFVGQD